ncbi:MAG: hypothetical protein DDT19_01875 [Syntrophomonadaceae bacterium]|nr:hypothetical protein [Bacillota bacterium]
MSDEDVHVSCGVYVVISEPLDGVERLKFKGGRFNGTECGDVVEINDQLFLSSADFIAI